MQYPKLTFQEVSLDLGDTYYGDDLEYYPRDVIWVAELLAMSRSAGLEHPLSVRLSLDDFYEVIDTYRNSEVRYISEKGGDTVGVAAWYDRLPEYRYLEALTIAPAARGCRMGVQCFKPLCVMPFAMGCQSYALMRSLVRLVFISVMAQ